MLSSVNSPKLNDMASAKTELITAKIIANKKIFFFIKIILTKIEFQPKS